MGGIVKPDTSTKYIYTDDGHRQPNYPPRQITRSGTAVIGPAASYIPLFVRADSVHGDIAYRGTSAYSGEMTWVGTGDNGDTIVISEGVPVWTPLTLDSVVRANRNASEQFGTIIASGNSSLYATVGEGVFSAITSGPLPRNYRSVEMNYEFLRFTQEFSGFAALFTGTLRPGSMASDYSWTLPSRNGYLHTTTSGSAGVTKTVTVAGSSMVVEDGIIVSWE